MLEMVEARRNGDKIEGRSDLFSGLLYAVQDETDNGAGLSDEELIGWYLIVRHSWNASYSSSQETCSSFFLPDTRLDLPLPHTVLPQAFPYRPQRIHYALHSPCWLSTLM